MSDTKDPEIVATLEDDSGDSSVDILRHDAGHFTYVEYHRLPDSEDDWQEVVNDAPQTYKTQYAAYAAATRDVDWLLD